MALEGTLRDFSFADILQLISLQRKTGVLTLKNEGNVVTISFLDGNIIGSSSLSQHPEDRIGLILLKQGVISEAELEQALKSQEETLQRLGRILIDHGMVVSDAVRKALSRQILQIIFRVFRWGDGDYHFSQETDIDYDRDLMRPMAADSIIMEGARMTDEWPFIDQRLPDRTVVFIQTDPDRRFDLTEEGDDDLTNLGFSFSDTPEEEPSRPEGEARLTPLQFEVYELVNGLLSVHEIIADSPHVEFDTCKALADLLDRGFIHEATQEEVARRLSRQMAIPVDGEAPARGFIPWLAIPFLVLLGFSMSGMERNPTNPSFDFWERYWNGYILESASWFRLERLCRTAEGVFYLDGIYPDTIRRLLDGAGDVPADFVDPWSRSYRLTTRGNRLMVTGSDSEGDQIPQLILSRAVAWEGDGQPTTIPGPGVRLIEE